MKTSGIAPVLREPAELELVASGGRQRIRAPVMAIGDDRLRLQLRTELEVTPGARVSLTLRRWSGEPGLAVQGRVWAVVGDDQVAEIELDSLSIRARAQLADLALWDATRDGDRIHVRLRGRFDERTDFSQLNLDAFRRAVFDVSGLRTINSWGARQWIIFLRSLPRELSYLFVDASLEFIKHCNMIADMVGRGRIDSLYAPYACAGCNSEVERRIETATLTRAVHSVAPTFRCPSCGGDEELDDVPRRYFAFFQG